MESKKVVSVRLSQSMLDEISKSKDSCSVYPNRSDIIDAALRLYLAARKAGLSNKVLRFRPEYGDVVDEIKFEYHR